MQTLFSKEAIESWAAFFALLYLLWAMKESWLCWPAAIISSILYLYVFFDARLYTESVLQLFYVAMSVYGWIKWTARKEHAPEQIKIWGKASHAKAVLVSLAFAMPVAYLLACYSNASFPYLDSSLTAFSITTTYMVALKVLENWIYWIIIDAVSSVVYFVKGLYISSFLFLLYTILAIVGLRQWRRLFLASHNK